MNDDTTPPLSVDPAEVLLDLEARRQGGTFAADLAKLHPVRYQAARCRPGLIERIAADGNRTVGQWRDGRFVVADE